MEGGGIDWCSGMTLGEISSLVFDICEGWRGRLRGE